jgi:hypothetical protein
MANQVRPVSGPGPSIPDGNALSPYYDPPANTIHNLYFSLASPPSGVHLSSVPTVSIILFALSILRSNEILYALLLFHGLPKE